ncbi:MAG: peptide chain release factor 2 [Tenericutes bacterium]|nr:peptide chain release factor 2 [Mycoplasmatota bacterium]
MYGGRFDITSKLNELKEKEDEMAKPTFWDDKEKADLTLKDISELKNLTQDIKKLKEDTENNLELIELLLVEKDDELLHNLEEEVKNENKKLEELSILLLLNGPYDKNNCTLEVHSGAGGTEACDWAAMLYRMYLRYCEKHGYKVEVVDYQEGEEVGIKSATIEIKGTNAYGYLKGEKGVHRLVRLSPFDAANKRHTSFASIDIIPEFDNTINVDINEKDLKIDVYRSSGKGGQGVNTTDSAVRITHLPTKTVVTCQNERSQIQNKETAMKMLKAKLYLIEQEKKNQELNAIKGNYQNIEFGSQIRSYVMHPYSMVKDHRTNYETSNVGKVLDGDLDLFIESYLKGE